MTASVSQLDVTSSENRFSYFYVREFEVRTVHSAKSLHELVSYL